MKILAMVNLFIGVFGLLFMPAMFGKERVPHDFKGWLWCIIFTLPSLVLSLYVMGWV